MTRRQPKQYDWRRLLFDEQLLTKHFTRQSSKRVQFIVVHHTAMTGSDERALDAIYRTWQTRRASAHYAVVNSFVRQYVWDKNAAWSVGSWAANTKSISIEHVNSVGAPSWKISDETMRTGAKLVAYLHWVYKLGRPVSGKTLRQHREFTSTQCPGPYVVAKWNDYVKLAQREYESIVGASKPPAQKPTPNRVKHYIVRSGDTLSAIARKFGTTVAQLVKWNRIENPNRIDVGDDLIVSASASTARRFSLRSWKWQGPTVENGKMIERRQPAIESFADTSFRWVDGSLVLTAPASGFTSPGSKYPRSELREMSGSRQAEWSNSSGRHTMSMTGAVTHLPDRKRHVVCAQVHDRSDDVLMIRLEDHRLFVEHDGDDVGLLDIDYKLGQLFTVTISAHDSRFVVDYVSGNVSRRVELRGNVSRCYFKAGCYTQATSRVKKSDKSYGTGFGQVRIDALSVSHG